MSEQNETEEKAGVSRSAVQPVVNCQHTITRGKEGEKGSWCTECGIKVFDVDDRECKDCVHFFGSHCYHGCGKHLMAVVPDMHVTFEIEKGTCWTGS